MSRYRLRPSPAQVAQDLRRQRAHHDGGQVEHADPGERSRIIDIHVDNFNLAVTHYNPVPLSFQKLYMGVKILTYRER